MAESVVSFLVEELGSLAVQEIGQLAVQEIGLLKSVGDEIREIKDEFSSMQALLKDADAKEDGDERVKEWLKQVRDVAHETEDVLDDFRLFQHKSFVHVFINLKTRHQLAKRIQDIKSKVSGIASRKDKYGLNKWEQGSTSQTTDVKEKRDPRNDALFIKEARLVGIDDSRDELVRWLVSGDQQSLVFSVYGQGGLGKTTLVKKAFDNQSVMNHFPYRAWVTVSETFEIKKLLIDLIEQILKDKKQELKDMDTNKLKEMLRNVLTGKRYILVFDDIWKSGAWNDLKNAFPDDIGCNSRIIVTTRFHNIAQECTSESKYSLAFELPLLTTDDAFKLFCKVAFPLDDSNCCPPSLVEISKKFVEKCKGLPLAVVSVAGLLRIKKPVEWNQVYDNLGQLMRSNGKFDDLNCIISLSYTDLPFHLKSCFLYLCIFPEDYSIRRRQLLQLWVAEGFIERKGMSTDMTMEDIAMGYLDELINRCLVQVESFGLSGRVKTCRVHDVVREFIIAKAEEQDFVTHFDRDGLHDNQVIGRRLSCLEDAKNVFNLLEEKESLFSHLRSFISFDQRDCYSRRAHKIICRFKLLRVFKVDAYDYDYKEGIFSHRAIIWHKLSHLRYLCLGILLSDRRLILGICHGRFRDLEVLEANGITIRRNELKEILKLKRLRYLSVECLYLRAVGIEKLSNLEHLSWVDVSGRERCGVLKGLGMLTQMRKLKVSGPKEEDGIHFCTSIQKMKYLRSLGLCSSRLDLQSLRFPPQSLEKIFLRGEMDTFPLWFSKLPNLIKLTLLDCNIRDESLLKSLQDLPCLAKLTLLVQAFMGEELYFEKGGFASLKELKFSSLPNMKKMTVEEGAMPLLEKLSFDNCMELQNAPLGIEYLTALKTINKGAMPKRFIDEIRNQVWKTGHTPLHR